MDSFEKLANQLAERLGLGYEVKIIKPRIIVTIPDNEYDYEKKELEINHHLSELNFENLSTIYVKVIYKDEEEGKATHRDLIRLLNNTPFKKNNIKYLNNHVEITLPDDNKGDFVKKSLEIMKIVTSVEENSLVVSTPVHFRIKRSYREINFVLQKDHSTNINNVGNLNSLQAEILYLLCNDIPLKKRIVKSSDFGISDSELASALGDLDAYEFIDADFDFTTLAAFFNEGEIVEIEYPESYTISLLKKQILKIFQE